MKRYYKEEKSYWPGHYNYYIFEDGARVGVCYIGDDNDGPYDVELGNDRTPSGEISEEEFWKDIMIERL